MEGEQRLCSESHTSCLNVLSQYLSIKSLKSAMRLLSSPYIKDYAPESSPHPGPVDFTSSLSYRRSKTAACMANTKSAHFIFVLHESRAGGGWAGVSKHGRVCFEDDLPFVGTWKEGAKSTGPRRAMIEHTRAGAGTTPNVNRKNNRFYATHLIEQKRMTFPCREQRVHHHPCRMIPATIEVVSAISPT